MITKADVDELKTELVPEIVDKVTKALKDKLDKIYTLVDGFAGEVKTYREQQELNSKTLSEHSDRLEKLERRQTHS